MLVNLNDYIKRENYLKYEFTGVVIDNEDPKNLGRAKVFVEGLFENDQEQVPWASLKGSSWGSGSGDNVAFIPEIGAKVNVKFPYEDIYFPVYEGTWQNASSSMGDFSKDVGGIVSGALKLLFDKGSGQIRITANGGELSIDSDVNLSGGSVNLNAQSELSVTSDGEATFSGDGGTNIGSGSAPTSVDGVVVELGGGGLPVARVTDQAIGIGVFGVPVMSNIVTGSPTVTSA